LAIFNGEVRQAASGNGLLYLREREPRRGWGVYVIRLDTLSRLVIEAPAPLDERGTAEAGVALFERFDARALAIGGSHRKANQDGTADVLRNYQTLFNIFHRELGKHDVLQVRSYDNELVTALSSDPETSHGEDQQVRKEMSSGLWVKSDVPEGVNLKEIRSMVGKLPVSWELSPVEGIQREASRGRYAELVLGAAAIRKVQSQLLLAGHGPDLRERDQGITGYLQEWILGTKGNIAESGTNLYVPPKSEELLFFDEEVLTPLAQLISRRRGTNEWTDDALEELRALDADAAIMGYAVTRYLHRESGREYLLLGEREHVARRRYWGTYVFRIEPGAGYVVQVPRPIFELNSFEAGVALFETLRAEALLIAGADPNANADRSADMLNAQNMSNLFNLVNQVILREAGARNMLVLQSRAFGVRPDQAVASSAALLAFDNGAHAASMLTPMAKILAQSVRSAGLDYSFVDGSPGTVGYEVGNLPQSLYIKQSRNKEFGVLWLSPVARWSFRQQSENRMQQAQFHSVGIPTQEDSLAHRIGLADGTVPTRTLPPALRQTLRGYLANQDIVSLHKAHSQYPAYRLERLIDRDSQRAFLLVYQRQGNRLALGLNLGAHDFDSTLALSHSEKKKGIERYVESGSAWLEIGGSS
jgi:hypothetical protein